MENPQTPEQAPAQNNEFPVISQLERMIIKEQVTEQLRTVFDPEIPVNIFELGLVYDVTVNDRGLVDVTMTLTSPACPAAGGPGCGPPQSPSAQH